MISQRNIPNGARPVNRTLFVLAALLSAAAAPALAHTGAGSTSGFASGFGHPLGGLDHMLAMVAVGVLAAQQGGRGLWLIPAAFVAAMLAGGALGLAEAPLPFVEAGILGSVVVLGAVVALGRKLALPLVMGLAGLFAVFHGHAHGAEAPAAASALGYAAGFALATALLHVAGIGLAIATGRIAAEAAPRLLRIAGGGTALAGAALALA